MLVAVQLSIFRAESAADDSQVVVLRHHPQANVNALCIGNQKMKEHAKLDAHSC